MKIIVGKLVVLGHQGVGKTSTVLRYVEKNFTRDVSSTIGASFFTCKVKVENIMVKFQIWDTAGQERFKSMVPMFYRNANAALLVFDITQAQTFESMKDWALELKKNIDERIVLCVIGNKTDLAHKRQISREEAVQYSHSIGATYFESSAKEDHGVEEIFKRLARDVIKITDEEAVHSLKVIYDSTGDEAMVAPSSDRTPTDEGRTELGSWSIESIAHGNTVPKSHCC